MFEIKYLKDFVGSYVNLVKSYDCDKTLGYALNNLMAAKVCNIFYHSTRVNDQVLKNGRSILIPLPAYEFKLIFCMTQGFIARVRVRNKS